MRSVTHLVRYWVGLAPAETQTTRAEQEAIVRHAAGRRTCVEIGVWHGVNTRRIREVMALSGTVTGVDPFPSGRLGFSIPMRVALREIARCQRGRFRLLRTTGADAARAWTEPVDFLFIDGDHSWEGLRSDWEGWSSLVAPGGRVCLHDSRSSSERAIDDAGSVRYTRDVILHDRRFRMIEAVETLTVLERVADRPAMPSADAPA